MYDDTKADETTVTVIATGLHSVGGTASKLQSRLEHKASMLSATGALGNTQNITRTDFGNMGNVERPTFASRTQQNAEMPQLQTPRTPVSNVKEQSIKIPDFFKK